MNNIHVALYASGHLKQIYIYIYIYIYIIFFLYRMFYIYVVLVISICTLYCIYAPCYPIATQFHVLLSHMDVQRLINVLL